MRSRWTHRAAANKGASIMARALECIASIYSSLDVPEAWEDALENLRSTFGSDASAIGLYECIGGRVHYLWSVGLRLNLVDSSAARPAWASPWLCEFLGAARPGEVWLSQWLVRPEQLATSEFYEQWLRPQGLLHFSCGIAWRAGDQVVCLEHWRRAGRPPFNRYHSMQFVRFLPHLGRAWEAYRRIHPVEPRRAQVQIVPWSPPSTNGWEIRRLAKDQPAGAAEAADGRVLRRRGAGRRRKGFRQPVEAGDDDAATTGLGHSPRAERHGAAAVTMDLEADAVDRARWRESVCATPYFQRSSDEERLRLLYHLTRAEARLGVLLARGLTLREAAIRLDVETSTIRTHLQRIYEKTGTHRQSELVRLLLTGPAALREE